MNQSNGNMVIQSFLIVMAMYLAWIFVRKLRRFFEWRKDDTFQTYYARASEEHRKDKQASINMFGSTEATNKANFVNFFSGLAAVMFMTTFLTLAWLVIAYLAIGFVVSSTAAKAARTVEFKRLLIADRIWFRMYFAWGWPYWVLRKSNDGDQIS